MNNSHPFQHLPRSPQSHFTLHYFAAIYWLLHFVRQTAVSPTDNPLDQLLQDHDFLNGYLGEIVHAMPEDVTWDDGLRWWQQAITSWEQGQTLPLAALTAELGLTLLDRLLLIIVGLVEEDSRFAAIFTDLQGVGLERPTAQLLEQIARSSDQPLSGGTGRGLMAVGLLEPLNREAPRSAWRLRVPLLLWDLLRDGVLADTAAFEFRPATAYPPPADLCFPAEFREQVMRLPQLLQSGQAETAVLRGGEGSDRERVAGSIARGLNRSVIRFQAAKLAEPDFMRQLRPICALLQAIPVIIFALGPGETADLTPLRQLPGPLCLLLGSEGGLRGQRSTGAVTLTLPPLSYEQRQQHWQQALGTFAGSDLTAIAERFHLPARHIRHAARLATHQATLHQCPQVTLADVRHACRTLNHQLLDNLAVHIETKGTWQQLVVRPATETKLFELERRCRHRERLGQHLAPVFAANHHRGVRALLTGASGTGKTMAVRILAAELGMDLYRVDLAAIVNKYIGETEKNLHRIFSRAEALDVILLFDEGDALFGNRTEVRSANDRYANLETNYLLQRLEHYSGIVAITTNMGDNIDAGFRRRMDVVIDFVPPQAQERQRIWHLHLPANHQVPSAFVDYAAAACRLTGGQIRNAAIFATLLALDAQTAIGQSHVEEAIRNEYRKAGAVCPLQTASVAVNGQAGLANFVNSFTT